MGFSSRVRVATFIIAIAYSAVPFAQDKIIVASDEWCPYNCVPGSEFPGYIVEIVKTIFAEHNISVEYVKAPWTLAIKGVEAGQYNAALAATAMTIPNAVFPQEEVGYYSNDFIVLKESGWRFSGINSLMSVKLGVIRGYVYGPNLDAYVWKPNNPLVDVLAGVNASQLNISKLYKKRIDVYLEDANVAYYQARKLRLDKYIQRAGSEGKPAALYVAFSPSLPSSKKYAEMFSLGIQNMRRSGKLLYILNKYGVKDWK
jgi:polar amino acid transport system substrate-binding protein